MPESALAKKLQIRPHQKLLVLDAPAGYINELGALPEGVKLAHRATGVFDVVHLFVHNGGELAKRAEVATKATKPGGTLWVSWPKQSAHMETDLNRDSLAAAMEAHGVRPVASVSINETWSALRFKPHAEVKSRR